MSNASRLVAKLGQPLEPLGVSRAPNGEIDIVRRYEDAQGWVPAIPLCALGNSSFCAEHGMELAYMAGSMANGISSVELVEELASVGMLGSFGAAGLTLEEIESAIVQIQANVGLSGGRFAFNLINSPNEPEQMRALVDLYLHHNVNLIEASAFMRPTVELLRYRADGVHLSPSGSVSVPNRIIAKVSRPDIARQFFSPPSEALLMEGVSSGALSEVQAEMMRRIPLAQDVTAEADSGGHTDNQSLTALLPSVIQVAREVEAGLEHRFKLRVGAAGGIATPDSVLAAFAMGAAYVVTGSINQACVEAGTSRVIKEMLAQAEPSDVAMCPAADMFEQGVQLQVLQRGTMFPQRARQLYQWYDRYDSLSELSVDERSRLEKEILRQPIDDVWQETVIFWRDRMGQDISYLPPKQRMSVLFRWYLGSSSKWAQNGVEERRLDYQIWCGQAMGAFNRWTRGSFLERPDERNVKTVALNLLYGAAVLFRERILRAQGFDFDSASLGRPLPSHVILEKIYE